MPLNLITTTFFRFMYHHQKNHWVIYHLNIRFSTSDYNYQYYYTPLSQITNHYWHVKKNITSENLIALSKQPRKVNSSDADHFFKKTEKD